MKRNWSRIFVLVLGIPLLLMMLAACGAGTSTSSSNTPTRRFYPYQDCYRTAGIRQGSGPWQTYREQRPTWQ